jgi:hypothetical protein
MGMVSRWMKPLIAVGLVLAPASLTACATVVSVQDAPVTEGIMQEFAVGYDVMKAAALESVERLNVDVQGTDENAERFQIRFSKPISAFSWGEVGVVNVVRVDDTHARVYVNSEKRNQSQISGTSERQFADQIFANINESLARLQR